MTGKTDITGEWPAIVPAILDATFLSLAHELGNPINSIKMTLEVLLNNYDSYSTQTRLEYLKSIHAEFRRLENLLNAIRSFNQFEQLACETVDVSALLRNLLQMLQKEMEEKKITLSVSPAAEPVKACCDPRALQLALLNVVANALDALNGRDRPAMAITVQKQGPSCLIRVADNGCGMSESKRHEIFLPFSSGKPQHAGLGLTMAKKVLTRMNGTITLSPRDPHGTEVVIRLPLAASPDG